MPKLSPRKKKPKKPKSAFDAMAGCIPCKGTGRASNGNVCFPCGGTGRPRKRNAGGY